MKSLCENSYGCLADDTTQVGTELVLGGGVVMCGRCIDCAQAFIELFCGPIEYFSLKEKWIKVGTAQAELETMLLWHLLQPEIAKLDALR